jgi:hypothetical protein
MKTADTPRDYSVLLPPGLARIPLDGREGARVTAPAAQRTASLPEPQRYELRTDSPHCCAPHSETRAHAAGSTSCSAWRNATASHLLRLAWLAFWTGARRRRWTCWQPNCQQMGATPR